MGKPITTDLREKMDTLGWYDEDGNIVCTTGGKPASEMACLVINSKTFGNLCDAIDAVQANLERENESLSECVRNQRRQLADVQDALERRNNGELKARWQKRLDELRDRFEDYKARSVLLPVDASGEVIHVGDVMSHDRPCVKSPAPVDYMELWKGSDFYGWTIRLDESSAQGFSGCELRHHHPDTWERIIADALRQGDAQDPAALVARCRALAGDA